jgi:hypothetical protein
MDFDDQGNVAHKTYLFLESENLKRDRFDAILENNLRTADGYFPALMSIIFGGKSAAQAIDDIFKG